MTFPCLPACPSISYVGVGESKKPSRHSKTYNGQIQGRVFLERQDQDLRDQDLSDQDLRDQDHRDQDLRDQDPRDQDLRDTAPLK
ncbi:hypothetical protein ACOMHN_061393 [Nucella lapillus]